MQHFLGYLKIVFWQFHLTGWMNLNNIFTVLPLIVCHFCQALTKARELDLLIPILDPNTNTSNVLKRRIFSFQPTFSYGDQDRSWPKSTQILHTLCIHFAHTLHTNYTYFTNTLHTLCAHFVHTLTTLCTHCTHFAHTLHKLCTNFIHILHTLYTHFTHTSHTVRTHFSQTLQCLCTLFSHFEHTLHTLCI